ncbi:MAG: dTMP kinase, partial [Nitrospira sp. NTP1]|nr:dTMP kinase [Nitrospira sp. NTP1]
ARIKVIPSRASKETVARAVARIVAPVLKRAHRADHLTTLARAASSHATQVHHALR